MANCQRLPFVGGLGLPDETQRDHNRIGQLVPGGIGMAGHGLSHFLGGILRNGLGRDLFLAVPRLMAHEAPVADQVIHACVNEKSGEIKIVDPVGDRGSKDKGSKDSNDGWKKRTLYWTGTR